MSVLIRSRWRKSQRRKSFDLLTGRPTNQPTNRPRGFCSVLKPFVASSWCCRRPAVVQKLLQKLSSSVQKFRNLIQRLLVIPDVARWRQMARSFVATTSVICRPENGLGGGLDGLNVGFHKILLPLTSAVENVAELLRKTTDLDGKIHSWAVSMPLWGEVVISVTRNLTFSPLWANR